MADETRFGNGSIDALENVIKFVFSWVIMMPVSIIISGQFLETQIKAVENANNKFSINLGILRIESSGSQVAFGFATFLIVFLALVTIGGVSIYEWLRPRLGVDPGQFHTICFLSSIITILISFSIHLLGSMRGASLFISSRERDEILKRVSRTKVGKS